MASRSAWALSVLLPFAVLIVGANGQQEDARKRPLGAVIATATLKGQATATGKATLNWDNGQGSVKCVLRGSLANMTMIHIQLANSSAGNPIVFGILPRMNSSRPLQLNPPASFSKGPFAFDATFGQAALAAIRPDMTSETFLSLLARDLLFVNVRTLAQPIGAVRGTLKCKGVCRERLL